MDTAACVGGKRRIPVAIVMHCQQQEIVTALRHWEDLQAFETWQQNSDSIWLRRMVPLWYYALTLERGKVV